MPVISPPTSMTPTSNTLPMRSSAHTSHLQHQQQHHQQHQQQSSYHQQPQQHHQHQQHQHQPNQLPFSPIQKHLNPCHGINTLPMGFSNSNIVGSIHNVNRSNQYANQLNNTSNGNSQHKQPYELEDLIHLSGPLTEDAVMRTLQARFNENCYFVSIYQQKYTHSCNFFTYLPIILAIIG